MKILYDRVKYRINESRKTLKLIEKVIRKENKEAGDLYFIITGDREMMEINREFLNRNSFTDVIAFDYSKGKEINGEIYISIETVENNSINYKVSLKEEVRRVMIHGVLHLCGYNDKSEYEKIRMREKEDYWIEIYKRQK